MTKASLVALTAFVLMGCGSQPDVAPTVGGSGEPLGATAVSSCSTAQPGCPCDGEGTTATCRVERWAGTYVTCSAGTMTCRGDGRWSACEGDRVWESDTGAD